ncbi:DUF3078 domain-containing protein [Arenibacter certesii]|uniref:DUF3078 domain-containing protein n=1 Tax=Arenibacter certesii TaxID=228955 RepID=A0A918IZB3_9FLAO|nr:DUF3078 domain-containing protein [Arenibacter certesii]GGW37785.1 hypothetical protein GCM10007383_23240 [Arenibacter certesii]
MSSKIIFITLLYLCIAPLNAQINPSHKSESDTLRVTPISVDTMRIDTMRVDTIVIRTLQNKIKNISRGANLTGPTINFNKTKALDEEYRPFRIPSFWDKENKLSINLNEVAFVNWNAGGNNSISALANIKFLRNYKFRYVQWENLLELRYGLNSQENQKLRKADDAIRFSSTFAYRRDTISNWYYSVRANFNTQFSNGYKYPNREAPVSRFMSPGYGFIGAGTSYIPEGKKFNLYLSPFTQKVTFVLDQDLADKGAFGVEKAKYDANKNKIKDGENSVIEFGVLITNTWQGEIFENVGVRHRLSLYSDYLESFGNIDVEWELNFALKVNKYISTTFGTHILYDDDIKFDPIKADDGSIISDGSPKIQFKQLFGVGVNYNF